MMRHSLLFRKTYNLVTEDATDSKDCVPDDELLQQGIHFTAKVHFFVVILCTLFCFRVVHDTELN